ncbi:MAG: GNAT family N-acetyltransferase [Bacteroidia bacterium]
MNAIRVTAPSTPQEFEHYYQLRWEVLRKPWNQPIGSERDEAEASAIHAMIYEQEECLAVGRLQFNSETEAQVRFMGVRADQNGRGLGRAIMDYLEEKAVANGRNHIVLQARENAVVFYERLGYTITEKSFLLWGIIQHYKMEKLIDLSH